MIEVLCYMLFISLCGLDAFLSFSQRMTLSISFVKERRHHPWVVWGVPQWFYSLEPLLDLLEAWGSKGAPCLWLMPCLTLHLGAWAALAFSAAGFVYGCPLPWLSWPGVAEW